MKVLSYDEWYAWCDKNLAPNGRDPSNEGLEFRIVKCALTMMMGQGTFTGDPGLAAKDMISRRIGA